MAKRRMFTQAIIDTDDFLSMPTTSQLLYFHLGMRADDDGFVSNLKTILKITSCKVKDVDILKDNGYIIPFDSGVIVIKHWHLHNKLRKDRYIPTMCKEKEMVKIDEDEVYQMTTKCQPNVNQVSTKCQPNDNQVTA